MEQAKFKKTWNQISSENNFLKYISLFLSVAVIMTTFGWLQTRETVVLVPPHLDERVWVSSNNASAGYKKAWSLAVATLVGNVSPSNADFIVEVMGDLLEPEAYKRIKKNLVEQAEDIKDGALTVTFEPQSLQFEEKSDKIFIYGKTIAEGPNKVADTTQRTFEFIIGMAFGSPKVKHFDVYEGQPRTLQYLEANKK